MKNHLIIFSKNRACQLELLLTSIYKNANDLFDKISILYKSFDDFNEGYKLLINKQNFKDINFYSENYFDSDLFNLISNDYDLTTFVVDDAVIYKNINGKKNTILNCFTNNTVCFSLRLGLNCNYSHPANLNYKIKDYVINDGIVTVDYYLQEIGDFKYPLSTDGHIYKTNFIKGLLQAIPFNNPNTLEANLQTFVIRNVIPRFIHFFEDSKLVSIPVNLVNTTFNNRNGLFYNISAEKLNEKYLNGNIIDFDLLNFDNINGPHKELNYEFKRG